VNDGRTLFSITQCCRVDVLYCQRIGFCATDLPSVTELHSDDADDALFETIMTNSVHILQPYLPERHELTISGIVHTIGLL